MSNRYPAPIIGIVGRSGSGKTTLIEKLIPVLKARGYRVGTIKHHAHPGFEMDRPGKDTWRHAQAGSDHVVIACPDKFASIEQLQRELSFEEVAARVTDVDIILTDGYSGASIPKIEIMRAASGRPPICEPEELLAIASDYPVEIGVPCYDLDAIEALVDLIESQVVRTP